MKKIILILAIVISTGVSAQQTPELKTLEVAPGITVIAGGGGNVAVLVGQDYVAMIDNGYGGPIPEIMVSKVSEVVDRPVNLIINTHVHGDHTGGNALFAETGTVIFAHENIRKRLLANPAEAGGPGGLPVVTFRDGVTFHLNGLEARVFHIPAAHTDGDSAIIFDNANVLHAGDMLFHGLFPYIDLDQGGTVNGYIQAQEKMLTMVNDDTVIIPGHGEMTDKAGMMADLEMLIGSKAKVDALVAEGMSDEEIVAANPLAAYHDEFNWRFITTERMTRTLIRDAREN